ncbi:TPA: lysozyme inhibitor LprI family protein [Pseudomonas aeruginosa]
MKHLAFLALGGLLLAPLAEAASFDCEKAERADEKAICANRALNDKDVEMSVKYHFLHGLFAMGGRGAMQDRQQDWLRQRRRCGGDTDCLSRAYAQRIDELDKQYAGIDKPL